MVSLSIAITSKRFMRSSTCSVGRFSHLVSNAAVGEENDAIAELSRLRVMGHHHDRLVEVVDSPEQVEHSAAERLSRLLRARRRRSGRVASDRAMATLLLTTPAALKAGGAGGPGGARCR